MKNLKVGFHMVVGLKNGENFFGRIERVDGFNVLLSGFGDDSEGVDYRTVDLNTVEYYDTAEYIESLI